MKRLLLALLLVLAFAAPAMPANAAVVATCGGTAVIGGGCNTEFVANTGGYIIKLEPGRLFTGSLTAAVTSPTTGFAITGTYVLGVLVDGLDTLTQDLVAGFWKLSVIAGQAFPSIGRFAGSVNA